MNKNVSRYDKISFEEHKKLEFHNEYRREKAVYLKQFLFKSGRFLDVGCGSGFDLRHIADDMSVFVGIDESINMLIQAKEYTKQAGKSVLLVQADAKLLPFKSDIFDIVHSHELSVFNGENVTEQIRVLNEKNRVCKKGGYLAVVLPRKDYKTSGFMPTGEEQMKYLFRHAGIKFIKPVYYFGCLCWWSTSRVLMLFHRVCPVFVAKRFIKSSEEYLREITFFVMGLGVKVSNYSDRK